MLKPYMAVLAAYARPWSLRISGGFVLLFIIAGAATPSRPNSLGGWPAIPLLVACGIFFLLFSVATKEMFTTPLTRLAPRFCKRHMVVAGLLGGGTWAAVSGTIAGTTAATLLGTSSLVLTMIAFIGWGALIHPIVLFAFFMLAFMPSMTQAGQSLLVGAMAGGTPRASWCMLAAAATSVILLARKLAGLHEEEPGYQRWFDQAQGPFSSRQVLNEQQKAAISRSRFVRRRGERLERMLSRPVVGLWLESRRLRLAAGYPSFALATVAILAGVWSLQYLLGLDVPFAFSTAYPIAFALLLTWRSWRKVIAQEFVRPIGRQALFGRIGLTMGFDVLETALAGVLTAVAVGSIASPATLSDPDIHRKLLIAVCCIPLLISLAGYLLLIRSELGFLVLASIPAGVIPVVGVSLLKGEVLSHSSEIGAGALALGVLCCYGAYRAWLNADLT